MKLFTLTIILLLLTGSAVPCSMFKITMYGKTMVGNNEDAWRLDSKIWFETGGNGKYGAAYVGHSDLFPQGGINEAGLVFDGFAVYPRQLKPIYDKKKINNQADFIKMIMQHCKSAEEVQDMVNRYDRSVFNQAMFLFIDKTGRYLVVEADTTVIGNDAKYVLSNFCPSITPNLDAVKIERYQRGRKFLENKSDTALGFCLSVMDTMHECRAKLGDGTTYTSIYDLNEGLIYLYFYHNYKSGVKFNLQQELAKGNHVISMTGIFPRNPEYERFGGYKTPFNNMPLRLVFYAAGCFFIFSIIWFISKYALNKLMKRDVSAGSGINNSFLLLFIINLSMVFYLYVLSTNQGIFYFNAPYTIPGKFFLNASAWIPPAILAVIIPIVFLNIKMIKQSKWKQFSGWLFTLNTIAYGIMLFLFNYWKLFDVF